MILKVLDWLYELVIVMNEVILPLNHVSLLSTVYIIVGQRQLLAGVLGLETLPLLPAARAIAKSDVE